MAPHADRSRCARRARETIAALTALGYDIQLRDGTVAPQGNRDRLREL